MNEHSAIKLCQLFGFGEPLSPPKAVLGGLLHKMWHIQTHSGEYAIKELNPHIMTRKNIIEEYERSEKIAHAFKDKGIPAVVSILHQNNAVIILEGKHFIVYPWIDAKVLDKDVISASHAKKIGTVLAQLHQANLSFPELPNPGDDLRSNEYLISLSERSLQAKLPFAQHLHDKLNDILLWNKMYQEALLNLNTHLLVSHTDLDQKNVLWKNDGSPVLIDWEGAKLINPMHELISVALDWSGVTSLNIDIEILRVMLNEYQKAGGKLTSDIQDAFYVQMGGLNWLIYNIQRSLGEAATSESEIQLGIVQTYQTLRILEYLADNINLWVNNCNISY